ncbi:hypothetical protein [Myxococcus phage Mx1]|nr:hypothetical protein [Myxococcus phage Mx1]
MEERETKILRTKSGNISAIVSTEHEYYIGVVTKVHAPRDLGASPETAFYTFKEAAQALTESIPVEKWDDESQAVLKDWLE